jgi:hypothetical protein
MPVVDFLCLANARKHLGRCVAGLRADGAGWIRLVSKAPDGTLNWSQYLLKDGKDVAVLDFISAGVKAARPTLHQPENCVIDGTIWKKTTRPPEDAVPLLRKALFSGPELFGGTWDRVAMLELAEKPVGASLLLIAPECIDLVSIKRTDGKQQVRGRFALGTRPKLCHYDLSVTDPPWEALVKEKGPRSLRQSEQKFVATISLGEPFNGYCYKLLAAIIVLPPALAAHF